jgi:type II secretory ATPase GspE/PulE/Tfp pilus assembly ATPase PilB-like protein
MVQSAFAKRLVFGRVVANDTVNGIQVLLDMGIKPFLVAASIYCALAQRLVRKLCPKCREQYTPSPALIQEIALPLNNTVKFYRKTGCSACNQTGFQGSVALFELLVPTEEIREMISSRKSPQEIRHKAVDKGMLSLKKDGIKKAFQGLTTVEEVLGSL